MSRELNIRMIKSLRQNKKYINDTFNTNNSLTILLWKSAANTVNYLSYKILSTNDVRKANSERGRKVLIVVIRCIYNYVIAIKSICISEKISKFTLRTIKFLLFSMLRNVKRMFSCWDSWNFCFQFVSFGCFDFCEWWH